jgi:hypothetical protein
VGFHLVISGLESRQQHNQANGSVLIIWSFWPVVVYNLDNSTYGSIVKSYFRQDIHEQIDTLHEELIYKQGIFSCGIGHFFPTSVFDGFSLFGISS